jgi:putative ABC transport system permease protein
MGMWRRLWFGLLALFGRAQMDRDLTDEVQSYLEEAEMELIAEGASPEEARRTVRLRYGDGLSEREEVRSYGWENTVVILWSDLRVAVRRLRRDPGFTTIAVITLGLGIGATTAIFSVIRPVLFAPLPYPEAHRIVSVSDRSDDGALVQVTFGTYLELTARSTAFDALTVFKSWGPTLTGGEDPERLIGQRVSAAYFDVLGEQPVLGRGLEAEADRPGGPDLVVLSHGLWQRRFAGDPTIVGSLVYLDSNPFSVVGVMAPSFENVTAPAAQVWALLQYDPLAADFDGREWGHHLDMMGRAKPGVSLDGVREALGAIAAAPTSEFVRPMWASLGQGLTVRGLKDAATARARPTVFVLIGAGALLLGIACVNLTILLLARGSRRRGEVAMRAALGASRTRLAVSLLTESLVLAGLGATAGLVVARLGLAGLITASPPSLDGLGGGALDGAALAFALGVTTVVCVVFGVAPALARSDRGAIRASGRGSVGRRSSAPQTLVATEVAVAVVLLVGAGLVLRSTQRLFSIPPGFDSSSTVVFQISTTGLERGDAPTHRFFDQALAAIRDVPGVRSVTATSQLPLSGDIDMYGVTLDEAGRGAGVDGAAYRYAVSPGYLEAMGISHLRGRGLERQDVDGTTRVAVLSESLANRLFADEDPIGQRFHLGAITDEAYAIVGVAGDVKQESLGTGQTDAVYVASPQWHWADRLRWVVVRASSEPELLVPAIRSAIRRVDGNQPIVRVQTMEALVAQSEAQRRFVLMVLSAFAASALALAGVGLFGVLSGSVSERRREIGVRGALGASRNDIVTLVVRNGMRMTTVGLVAGVAVSAFATETLVTLLFEVSRLDAATYIAVIALLAGVAGVAIWVPASRAAQVNPVALLQSE